MKPYICIILTLFSVSASTRYEVEEYRCDKNEITIKYEDQWYPITLFNISVKQGVDVCKYMKGDIQIEWEENIDYEHTNSVYMFVDDVLLQKTLYEKDEAILLNPSLAFKYSIKEETLPVFKEIEEQVQEEKHTSFIVGWGMIMGYITFCIFLFSIKIHHRNHVNRSENNV